jgi:hypothetical protein
LKVTDGTGDEVRTTHVVVGEHAIESKIRLRRNHLCHGDVDEWSGVAGAPDMSVNDGALSGAKESQSKQQGRRNERLKQKR